METLVVATKNKGKLREFRAILGELFDVKSMDEVGIDLDVEETGVTFEENAILKAAALHRLVNTAVISDDSGLEVDALGGCPGVYSARYSKEGTDSANNALLLREMAGKNNRKARFVSVVALVRGENDIITARGEVEGEVMFGESGAGGFGYDPLFFCTELKKSFGDASAEEKNSVSHRYRALCGLLEKLRQVEV